MKTRVLVGVAALALALPACGPGSVTANAQAMDDYVAHVQGTLDEATVQGSASSFSSVEAAGELNADVARAIVTYTYANPTPTPSADDIASAISTFQSRWESQGFATMAEYGLTGVLQGEYIYLNQMAASSGARSTCRISTETCAISIPSRSTSRRCPALTFPNRPHQQPTVPRIADHLPEWSMLSRRLRP